MHVTVNQTLDREITLSATLPELVTLYQALTATGRRSSRDKAVLTILAQALLVDKDIAAAVEAAS